jgi:hypothetical protein
MMRLTTIVKLAAMLCVLFIMYCCTTSSGDHSNGGPGKHVTVVDRIKKHNDSIQYTVSSAAVMEQVKTVLAQIHDTVSVLIPERTSQLKSFPCANCHSKPVEQLAAKKENEKNSHWDIHLKHGSTDVMNCFTCHNKKNLNELVSLTGNTIVLDESYKLCGQCHSTQLKDWVGGSHGKRLGGWAPPRIINTCVNCHNPHQPAFPVRWPSWFNTVTQSKIKAE